MAPSIKACCIKGCTEKSRKEQQIKLPVKFYSFPQNNYGAPWKESKRKKWINAVKNYVKNPKDWEPTVNTRICSAHFIDNKKSEHPLHPSYVPSLFPEKKNTKNLTQSLQRFERLKKRQLKRNINKELMIIDNVNESVQNNDSAGNNDDDNNTSDITMEQEPVEFEHQELSNPEMSDSSYSHPVYRSIICQTDELSNHSSDDYSYFFCNLERGEGMGKKRLAHLPTPNRIKVEVKDEIPDNEVHVARDRLKGALRELLHHSDEGSSMDSSEDIPAQEMKHSTKRTPKSAIPQPPSRRIRRRRQLPADQLFHHTYVMKLFDRSVDLAQFREDTPLYPICRAWLANQPRNPNLVPKVRSPSPEIVDESQSDSFLEDGNGELCDVYSLPQPLPREEILTRNRIPSPIPQPKDKLELNYEGQVLKSRDTLMRGHRAHWGAIRRKWHSKAQKNEKRFYKSAHILGTIFKRAQTEFE